MNVDGVVVHLEFYVVVVMKWWIAGGERGCRQREQQRWWCKVVVGMAGDDVMSRW